MHVQSERAVPCQLLQQCSRVLQVHGMLNKLSCSKFCRLALTDLDSDFETDFLRFFNRVFECFLLLEVHLLCVDAHVLFLDALRTEQLAEHRKA